MPGGHSQRERAPGGRDREQRFLRLLFNLQLLRLLQDSTYVVGRRYAFWSLGAPPRIGIEESINKQLAGEDNFTRRRSIGLK